jgi:AraC-like DNA-binding protein
VQTRIDIIRVDGDPGRPPDTRSFGRRENDPAITVLNGMARRFVAREQNGAYSLKWIPRGVARYSVDRVHHYLAGDKLLLLDAGQPYEVEFLDSSGTESFCLFFSDALRCEASTNAAAGRETAQFADMVFAPPPDLRAALRALRQNLTRADVVLAAFEEKLLGVLARTVALGAEHRRLVERVPAKRAATRRRLLSRLQRAREMIEDCAERPPDLAQLAEVSALSKFHLLRLFGETFGATPLEYAQRRRVERAKHLLRHSRLSIARIAETLGYESQSAFARTFRRHTATTPRAFRSGGRT